MLRERFFGQEEKVRERFNDVTRISYEPEERIFYVYQGPSHERRLVGEFSNVQDIEDQIIGGHLINRFWHRNYVKEGKPPRWSIGFEDQPVRVHVFAGFYGEGYNRVTIQEEKGAAKRVKEKAQRRGRLPEGYTAREFRYNPGKKTLQMTGHNPETDEYGYEVTLKSITGIEFSHQLEGSFKAGSLRVEFKEENSEVEVEGSVVTFYQTF